MGRIMQRPGAVRTFQLGTAPVLVLGKRSAAASRIVSNVGTDSVYVGFMAALSAGDGFTLLPGQALVTDAISAIWCLGSSATSLISILEEP